MKFRPILFSGPMVRALLDNSKTQTRRVAKHPLATAAKKILSYKNQSEFDCILQDESGGIIHCPYGKPGDRLWVRETFQPTFAPGVEHGAADWGTGEGYKPQYMATDIRVEWVDADDNITDRCKPAIHMPRWASRIELEITGVRVERLQDISEADARAEGAPDYEEGIDAPPPDGDHEWSYRASFRRLWESINGPGSWEANPWVWVVAFKRVEGGAK